MKYKHFSIEEREQIQEFVWQRVSLRKFEEFFVFLLTFIAILLTF